jgi:hypothetical protein
LGCLPLWGREGANLTTTTEYLLNNSYIEDFYRAVFCIKAKIRDHCEHRAISQSLHLHRSSSFTS